MTATAASGGRPDPATALDIAAACFNIARGYLQNATQERDQWQRILAHREKLGLVITVEEAKERVACAIANEACYKYIVAAVTASATRDTEALSETSIAVAK